VERTERVADDSTRPRLPPCMSGRRPSA